MRIGNRRVRVQIRDINADGHFAKLGLRVVCPHWYPSFAARRLRDWSSLHLYHAKAPASRHQGRGKESYSGMHYTTPYIACHSGFQHVVLIFVIIANRLASTLPSQTKGTITASTIPISPTRPTSPAAATCSNNRVAAYHKTRTCLLVICRMSVLLTRHQQSMEATSRAVDNTRCLLLACRNTLNTSPKVVQAYTCAMCVCRACVSDANLPTLADDTPNTLISQDGRGSSSGQSSL